MSTSMKISSNTTSLCCIDGRWLVLWQAISSCIRNNLFIYVLLSTLIHSKSNIKPQHLGQCNNAFAYDSAVKLCWEKVRWRRYLSKKKSICGVICGDTSTDTNHFVGWHSELEYVIHTSKNDFWGNINGNGRPISKVLNNHFISKNVYVCNVIMRKGLVLLLASCTLAQLKQAVTTLLALAN